MLRLYNTLNKKIEPFHPTKSKEVTLFTCGPSVYQRAHIGNFRTFLFEDILVRYLEYKGYNVMRSMNFTDVEDKAIREAEKQKITLHHLTEKNIKDFCREMKCLRMQIPDYLPRASENVDEAVGIILKLLSRKVAYWYKGNIYFDPLKFPGFGKLYGLNMSQWPSRKRRFHKDTYPGIQWNLGDFILWHGYKKGDKYFWETRIGRGRPSWNIQDPSMISKFTTNTLSFYCGGFDNLYRHHDYTRAITESVRPYPMSKFWLHCNHLTVNHKKMSKSKGNIIYTDSLRKKGYDYSEIRFFLIYNHYREKLDYTDNEIRLTVDKLRMLKKVIRKLKNRASKRHTGITKTAQTLKKKFDESLDNDLHVKNAFDTLYTILRPLKINQLDSQDAASIINILKKIDSILDVIF